MNLQDKLKGMPMVYYCNLDSRPDKREYMETQFDFWKINHTRVSSSKYTPKNYDEWKDLVVLNPEWDYFKDYFPYDYGEVRCQRHLVEVCFMLTQLETIKNWLETTEEKYMILMEDDHDLSMIEYMHFDWEYLMNNIPYDWDVIQFEVANGVGVPCFLHPTMDKSWTGPLLINRDYARKIIRIHYTDDNKVNFHQKLASYKWIKQADNPGVVPDYIISKNGKGYSIPLIYLNPDMGSYNINLMRTDLPEFYQHIKELYHKWWKVLRDDYTLEEFFSHGKPNDLILRVDSKFSLL
jgi:hypothetical protein